MAKPLIGITVDNRDNSAGSGKYEQAIAYSRVVAETGGLAVLLPHEPEHAMAYVDRCDALVLTGGVDPDVRLFGHALHGKARLVDPRRQRFETELLDAALQRPELPVLGVCLGMQMMALVAGGQIDQYLPETLGEDDAEVHLGDRHHPVEIVVDDGVLSTIDVPGAAWEVVSSHQQAVRDPGRLRVVAKAPDGVIEAIDHPGHRFFLGVQWHPERGGHGPINRGLFSSLLRACRGSR